MIETTIEVWKVDKKGKRTKRVKPRKAKQLLMEWEALGFDTSQDAVYYYGQIRNWQVPTIIAIGVFIVAAIIGFTLYVRHLLV